jgi:hypothetical protein
MPATEADIKMAGRDIPTLFRRLRLWLHPTKCDFVGKRKLEVLGTLVDTKRAMFLLSLAKLRNMENAARRLLTHAALHRRYVPDRVLHSFSGLGNSTNLAVVDARLRFWESFDSLRSTGRDADEIPAPARPDRERSERAGLLSQPRSRELGYFPAGGHGGHSGLLPAAESHQKTPRLAQPSLSHAALRDL